MPVLISSGSGSGRSEDEVLLASTLRLLARGTRPPVTALSVNVSVSARAHPDLTFHREEDIVAALESSAALLVVGNLSRPSRLERAALHVTLAKLAHVPTALVAVRMPRAESECERDLCALLAQCESVSTRDAESALAFLECSGQRAHTAAPLELLMRVAPRKNAAAHTLGLEEAWLDRVDPDFLRALESAAEATHTRLVAIAHEGVPRVAHRYERRAAASWSDWLQEISNCDAFLGRANGVALHVAAGQGVAPIALAEPAQHNDLHERLGLSDLVMTANARFEDARCVLERARAYTREMLGARAATLRTVAWRALGPLADTARSTPLVVDALPDAARRTLARAVEARVRRALESGDFGFAESELSSWRAHLERQPRWALAQAQLKILQGRETDARALLEGAVASSPEDTECLATLAMVMWRLGDTDAACRTWDRVAELEPSSARAPYQIGCLELLRGRIEQALRAWGEAQERDPAHAASRRALAQAPAPGARGGAA